MVHHLLSDQVDTKEIEIVIRELNRVIKKNISGHAVEFGCYLGTTSVYIAEILMAAHDREFYVYDSFIGLPEKTKEDISPLGDNFKSGELVASKKQFIKNMVQTGVPVPHIKKAWFRDLVQSDLPNKVAFAFLDGDYYASIVDPLKLLEVCLVSGSTIVVDDYSNAALPGVTKAVDEWLSKHRAVMKVERSLAIIYVS
jgi:O-methyltransferase